ncbi:MAG: response regulator [Alphaproteobacteria bacterium]|nr:response regulator [Alphaproteobacteria bacterium]
MGGVVGNAAAGQSKAYDLKGLRILVVEDFPFMADLMSAMLREFSIGKVLSVCQISEAQEHLQTYNMSTPQGQHIDLVMTDLFPPRDEGLQLMRWIREHRDDSIRFLPVLFCTAHTSLNVVTSGRDYGATEILVKPVSAEKLAHRLLHIIDHPRLT